MAERLQKNHKWKKRATQERKCNLTSGR